MCNWLHIGFIITSNGRYSSSCRFTDFRHVAFPPSTFSPSTSSSNQQHTASCATQWPSVNDRQHVWEWPHTILMELIFWCEMETHVVQEDIFSLMGAISVGLGNRLPPSPSTSLWSLQMTSQSVSQFPVSTQRSLSPECYLFRGQYRLSQI